ncbi:porin family protein [Mangrovicoccus algicola]|uniref:Porin n=1 Tax=Mangrovicoccus algicola TaxID=2771008 RepID=A0A8J6YTB2_9RHOB|nr:porin [Mangrovicoccus algicola]MBE3637427.1 porin [Mangrovicoccus algicola]
MPVTLSGARAAGLAGVIIGALPAIAAAQSYSSDTGGTVTFYGQVSPTFIGLDDGRDSEGVLADNAHSNTRLGFDLDQSLSGGAALRFKLETGLGAPQSSSFSQDDAPGWTWEKTDLRHADLSLEAGFGTLSLGQGSMASDGIAGSDLSGTALASAVATGDTAGGYLFRREDGALSDVAISDVFTDFDGGRKGRIRYDTPEVSGVTLAVAYGQEVLAGDDDADYYDIGLFYDAEMGELSLAAGLGGGWKDDGGDVSQSWAGSLSLLHAPTGLTGTVAGGGDPDGGSYVYVKAGILRDWWQIGSTAVSVDHYAGEDLGSDGAESRQTGIQMTQSVDDWNTEFYLGYAEYSHEDDSGAEYEDAASVIAGMRWRF